MGKVVVVGSINIDLVVTADRFPGPGETVTGSAFARIPGGKGANQAIAAARAGAKVAFVGAIGDDPFGNGLRAGLAAEGVDVAGVAVTAGVPTGTAVITLSGGENSIVVVAGANATVDAAAGSAAPVEADDLVVSVLEVPRPAIAAAFAKARAVGATTILNAAPALPEGRDLFGLTDILVVNAHELALYAAAPARAAAPAVPVGAAADAVAEWEVFETGSEADVFEAGSEAEESETASEIKMTETDSETEPTEIARTAMSETAFETEMAASASEAEMLRTASDEEVSETAPDSSPTETLRGVVPEAVGSADAVPAASSVDPGEDTELLEAGDEDAVVAACRALGVPAVVVTLGSAGLIAVTEAGIVRLPGHPVTVVDTTGAGDCFVGAFAAERLAGQPLAEALRFANAAAALSVGKAGASPSMPRRAAVEAFLARGAERT